MQDLKRELSSQQVVGLFLACPLYTRTQDREHTLCVFEDGRDTVDEKLYIGVAF